MRILKFAQKSIITFLIMNFTIFNSYATEEELKETKSFVNNIVTSALSILQSDINNEQEKETKLRNLFIDTVDIDWIGRFVLGRYYHSSTSEQKEKYHKLYKSFLLNSYIPSFRKYTSEQVKILNVYPSSNTEFIVQTEITKALAERNIKIDYRIRKINKHKYKIFDIIGEGVSLIATQRSEFNSIITNKGIDYLIAQLEARARQEK